MLTTDEQELLLTVKKLKSIDQNKELFITLLNEENLL